ncbi:MAG: hypothetical protein K2Y28_08445 [Burkholderiaceae bacterium]|nr:hypothetical protein [Burkholderiaceae bacterium]
MFSQTLAMILPWWARALAVVFACVSVFLLGQLHGERIAGEKHIEYVSAQAAQSVKIVKAQAKVVVETQVKYVDRIKKIYIKGEIIEKQVPIYVTQSDNAACVVNTGFVRVHDAAWTNTIAGPAADTDREPVAVSLAEVAETEAHNATSCHAWREQALGWREFYKRLKEATNKPE